MKVIDRLFKKNKNIKKVGILILCALFFFLLAFLLWELWLSNYYIFQKEEKTFTEAVQKYYEYRPSLLPKKGEIRSVTLEKLFLENRIESLKIPKTETLCDTNSWVKVYQNDNGEYIYYTYLKCGKYKSSVDHTGPVITLNGDDSVITNFGQEYKDLGVKSVVDDKDGKIDVSKVEIDTSKVNINKVGKYKVTYKVSDSLNNQTKVTRTVIVAKNLTEIVKNNTDASNYYKGKVENNYLQFSGMLFRIINVNEDGTVRLISDDITNNLRYVGDKYQDSNIDKWLTNVFLPSIESSKYLVDSNYCVGDISSVSDYSNSCSEIYKGKVGLLSVTDYQNTVVDSFSSVNYKNYYNFTFANRVNKEPVLMDNFRNMVTNYSSTLVPIKPVITIKANMYITSGTGEKTSPYKLTDYDYGVEHDKINSRIIGEYFNYSGITFRIIGHDGKNIKAISAEPLMNNTTNDPLEVSIENINNYSFNVKDENNPGYILNNQYIDYINENSIITSTYKLLTNSSNTTYDKFKSENIKTKLMLSSTTDLFSGVDSKMSNNIKKIQLYADKTENSNYIIMTNVSNGLSYELPTSSYNNFAVRVVTLLDGNLKIKTGNGTFNNPYILK